MRVLEAHDLMAPRDPVLVLRMIEGLAEELAGGLDQLPDRRRQEVRVRLGGCLRAVAEGLAQTGTITMVGTWAQQDATDAVRGHGLVIVDETMALSLAIPGAMVEEVRAVVLAEPDPERAPHEVALWMRERGVDRVLAGCGLRDLLRVARLIAAVLGRGSDG